MPKRIIAFLALTLLYLSSIAYSDTTVKKKILIVSSYHKEYPWSQETNKGICAAFLKFGYFDDKAQVAEFTANDYIETSKAIIKKMWMNTKRKKKTEDIETMVIRISDVYKEFKPDMIMLGDDNAAKYVGTHFLDTDTPIVFWGVNNTPVKYGLVNSIDKPGHNVTGVYQSGYNKEGIELLQRLAPTIKTFALLSDDTTTGRTRVRKVERLVQQKDIKLELVETVEERSFEKWKSKVLELQKRVDAFYITQIAGLEDKDGKSVSIEEITSWYIKNVKIPEAVGPGLFVKMGLLCSADDAGYRQGTVAGAIAYDILANGKDPATYPPKTPPKGELIVSKKRAKKLGITLTDDMGIEEYY